MDNRDILTTSARAISGGESGQLIGDKGYSGLYQFGAAYNPAKLYVPVEVPTRKIAADNGRQRGESEPPFESDES